MYFSAAALSALQLRPGSHTTILLILSYQEIPHSRLVVRVSKKNLTISFASTTKKNYIHHVILLDVNQVFETTTLPSPEGIASDTYYILALPVCIRCDLDVSQRSSYSAESQTDRWVAQNLRKTRIVRREDPRMYFLI